MYIAGIKNKIFYLDLVQSVDNEHVNKIFAGSVQPVVEGLKQNENKFVRSYTTGQSYKDFYTFDKFTNLS